MYIANEPIQLESLGLAVNVIEVSDYIDIVSNGIVTSERLVKKSPKLVERVIRATLRGLKETIDHPDEAFAITRQVIPEITDDQADMLQKVLRTSIALWKSDRLGFSRKQDWQSTLEFLYTSGMTPTKLPVENYYTNQFVD